MLEFGDDGCLSKWTTYDKTIRKDDDIEKNYASNIKGTSAAFERHWASEGNDCKKKVGSNIY